MQDPTTSPYIKRGYFKEVFDRFKDKLKCPEVELGTSSDDQSTNAQAQHSEEIEAQEIEENKFLIEQRTSSKNSRASS